MMCEFINSFNTQLANILSEKKTPDEFGVTEMAALRLAIRIEDAFKKARAAMVDFTKPLPDNQFDDMTLLEMIAALHANQCGFQYNSFGDLDVAGNFSSATPQENVFISLVSCLPVNLSVLSLP